MKKKQLIDINERELAAIYFALSNLAMLDTLKRSSYPCDLRSMYRQAEAILYYEGAEGGLSEELRYWQKAVKAGDGYVFERWNEVRSAYVN